MEKWNTRSGYGIIRVLSGRSNVFLLTNGDTNILIDTSVSRLWNRLRKRLAALNIRTIDYLILTHAHIDHAANANRIKKAFNAKVVLHAAEEHYLRNGDNILPRGTAFLTRLILNGVARSMLSVFRYEPCEPDILIDSEYDFGPIGFNAKLMHTPGHTVGSISAVVDDEIALVGDAMFGIFKRSVFPPFAEDEDSLVRSWGKLLATGCSVFLPSHGSANTRVVVQRDYDKRIRNRTGR